LALSSERPDASGGVCGVLAGLLRQALAVAAVLALLAATAELLLRAAGVEPQATRQPSNVVADGWTDFRLRPDVSGQEAFVTNDLGMHAPRSYATAPPPGFMRVAMLGSSVVYGLNLPFADTLPSALERELQAAGRPAEVLNFGAHAFSIVNVSAQLQAYAHQLQPHVAVVLVDLQVALVRWPPLRPAERSRAEGIETMGRGRALLARGASRSALAGLLDDPRPARRWLRRTTGLPLHPHPGLEPVRAVAPSSAPAAAAPSPGPSLVAEPVAGIADYERRRERELRAPLAAMAAFADAASIELYLVTPYGPYFGLSAEEIERMSVRHFIEDAARVHGDARVALEAEAALVSRVVRQVADDGPAHVVDLLDASRRAAREAPGHFTEDGVHLTPEGNAALGRIIATRLVRDLQAR
jgi:lysophospholipase L1-like esterase